MATYDDELHKVTLTVEEEIHVAKKLFQRIQKVVQGDDLLTAIRAVCLLDRTDPEE
jgi:hypothetical protein